ncbi:apolipoprotein N-acyltransferase [Scytonema hofmannii FACHB-248]|uniref:Apolipoprotein N-acyltransferase n=1 Tax=Scytonema hofmannii FACHB-248 TaxID=1842502 RepID=A0ABR8GPJ2_9CYAN|nr:MULTISPECIES: apolipoprotein N-acyltransferase [Nostocales]MBD2605078.1 apolipoprotein N-acyltransferase [Scytonema hofmannii FACHB-248]
MKYKIKKLFSVFNLYTSSLLSGTLMGLTVAPFNVWFLAWIALAPLWVLVIEESKNLQGKRKNFPLSPLLWGIGYHGLALYWITGIHPMTWMGVPWLASLGIALFCWTFITLWGAAIVAVWAIAMRMISSENGFTRVLIGTAIWCGLEALWSHGALWWSSLSYTQSPYNLVILHLGQLSGSSAVTAAIVAVNGLLAEAWITNRRDAESAERISLVPLGFVNKYLAIAAALLITLHVIGFSLYSRPLVEPPETALKVGIIQGNVPNEIKLYPEGFRRAIEGYTTGYLTLANQGINAVLTPEGALPFFLRDLKETSLISAIREKGVVAWIGAFGERGRSYTNSLFTFTGNGEIFSRYDKAKLVPIGEYVPFEQILGGIIQRLSPLDEHQVPGSPNQVFNTPFGRAIVGICYESAFSEQFRRQAAAGGEFILSPSNDAHYSAAMPAQHHAQDIMRAIETDRWGVRATNTGYSAFVDPHGRTLWISRHNTYETHAETIYRRQTQTFYVRWGDWLTPLLLGLAALAWFVESIHRNVQANNQPSKK